MPAFAQEGPRWLGTLLYVPLLYAVGWLTARPLALISPTLRPDQLDLAGLVLALLLLLLTLPRRLERVWGETRPWRRLGLRLPLANGLRSLLRGLLMASLLLTLVTAVLVMAGQASWSWRLGWGTALNGLALAAGVGFAEELLFRGWLWGELALQAGARQALLLQASIFGLLHPWYRLGGPGAIGLLGGLILLGIVLALQRRSDRGSLWGALGLHGGLVGGWFVLQTGMLEISSSAPGWLIGPGMPSPNPIGGVIGWLGLGGLLLWRSGHWQS
ncbi:MULTISPECIES: CPBP family intramembrane glutamic endopeptidase [Synechococcales]|uniref:CPBP family intramembrane glutamic endopeptidase n=1 Tax=Synechococcus sp. CS-1325 TaxID=2847979 RepID=UPI00223B35DF|nr:CPBP family intramembrane glutamic endopeptidase [Synechococcus sp. CS-1325]